MIKLINCLRRLPHLSLEEFQAHWLEYHSQFGRRLKLIRRNVQYHTLAHDPIREALAEASESGIEPYDGFVITWWDSLDDIKTELENNPNVAAAREDEKLFVDHNRSVHCLAQEQVIIEPEGSVPYVLIQCLRRRADIDQAAFQAAWLRHADIGRRAHTQGLLKGYIQNHTLPQGDSPEDPGATQQTWDGVVTAYFDSIAQFKALVTSPLVAQESLEDTKTFIDHSRSVSMLTRRSVISDVVR
ncbi:MAG: EthD domain-containing protein [Acidobacteria bacterium]|nr:EthD domain-containing protein [Acidobacteriota bacterium]